MLLSIGARLNRNRAQPGKKFNSRDSAEWSLWLVTKGIEITKGLTRYDVQDFDARFEDPVDCPRNFRNTDAHLGACVNGDHADVVHIGARRASDDQPAQ